MFGHWTGRLFIMILFSAIVPAVTAEISVTYPSTHQVTAGFPFNIPIQINNSQPHAIYNIDFSTIDGFAFPAIENISSGETKNITVITTILQSGIQSFSTTMSFQTLNATTTVPQTKTITINNTHISDNNLTIRKFDTVRWANTASNNLTVKANDDSFEIVVEPGAFVDREFVLIKTFDYEIVQTSFAAKIHVEPNVITSFLYDPSRDLTLTFDITANISSSDLIIQAPVNSFSLLHNESREGVLQLLSNIVAVNVVLTSDKWVTFRENNFSFSQQKIILFDLNPVVNRTNETGMVHEITITGKGDNTNSTETKINVFISQFNFTEAEQGLNRTVVVLATDEILEAFCRDNPDKCPTRNTTQIVFINRTEDVRTKNIEDILGRTDRIQNELRTLDSRLENVGGFLSNLTSGIRENTAYLEEQKRQQVREGRQNILKTILKILLYTIGSIMVAVMIFVYVIRKGMMERREMF